MERKGGQHEIGLWDDWGPKSLNRICCDGSLNYQLEKRWPGRQIGSPMKIWKLLEAAAFWRLNADIPSDLSLDPHLLV